MKYLVIGPGALGLFSLVGLLHKIKHKLDDVEEISGASAGSLIGLFLSLNKETDEILDFLLSADMKKYYKFNLKNFIKNFGFINLHETKHLYLDFFGYDPTFKDLKKKLYVAVYNVNYDRTEYLSVDTHPDMSVIDAVIISMSIPFLLTSTVMNDNYYIDGGIYDQIPLAPFLGKKKEDVLCVKLEISNIHNRKIKSLKDFVQFLFSKTLSSCSEKYDLNFFTIIKIFPDENINILDFKMSHEDKIKLFFNGYNQPLPNLA